MTKSSLKSQLRSYLKKQPVQVAYLYGSQSKGTANQDSDIDIGVLLQAKNKRAVLKKIEKDLTGLLNCPVQIENIEQAPPLLKHSIVLEGDLLLEKNRDQRIRLEVATLHEYEDNQCIFDLAYQGLKRKLNYE